MTVGFPPILKQFSFLYFLLQVLGFFIFGLFWWLLPILSTLFSHPSFPPDSEDIFCLFQRAHWVSRSCGTDGTTLRSALVNGQMRSLCSSSLASALSAEVCLCEPSGRGPRSSDAAAISRQRGRTGRSPNLPEQHLGSVGGHGRSVSRSAAQEPKANSHVPPRSTGITNLGKALKCKGR